MKKKVDAVYIHIPFCTNICHYCDFCKVFYQKKLVDEYLTSLEEEIKERYHQEKIRTIYIGGGTPTSLTKEQLIRLFTMIEIFHKSDDYEYTIEATIESLDQEKIFLFHQYGINRVSLGIETTRKEYQKILGRYTDLKKASRVIHDLKEKNITNINVDFMYGFSHETIQDIEKELKFFLSLDIPHISVYSLIIEENTRLKIEQYERLSDDLDYECYQTIEKILIKNGYCHYEISNYAKNGKESKHNLVYWNNEEYYGFGASAASYLNHRRFKNTKSVYRYIKGVRTKEEEILSEEEKMDYEIILGFRKEEGVSKEKFYHTYHKSIDSVYSYEDFVKKKVILETSSHICVNKKYRYVLNEVLVQFLSKKKIN